MTPTPLRPSRRLGTLVSVLSLSLACGDAPELARPPPGDEAADAGGAVAVPEAPEPSATLGKKPEVAPVPPEVAPAATARSEEPPDTRQLQTRVESYFANAIGRHVYLQVDKPLYQPGETIWIKSWDLRSRSLDNPATLSASYQLISPKGAVVLQKQVRETNGTATNDFEIPADVQGGEYTLKLVAADGTTGERPVIISTYEAPRLKMKLEFVRKAYGEGDEVTATFEVKRTTGEALGAHEVTGAIRLDGLDLPRVKLTTAADGTGQVRFTLPSPIAAGDGLLTMLVEISTRPGASPWRYRSIRSAVVEDGDWWLPLWSGAIITDLEFEPV